MIKMHCSSLFLGIIIEYGKKFFRKGWSMSISIRESGLSVQDIKELKEAAKQGKLTENKVLDIVAKDGEIDGEEQKFLENLKNDSNIKFDGQGEKEFSLDVKFASLDTRNQLPEKALDTVKKFAVLKEVRQLDSKGLLSKDDKAFLTSLKSQSVSTLDDKQIEKLKSVFDKTISNLMTIDVRSGVNSKATVWDVHKKLAQKETSAIAEIDKKITDIDNAIGVLKSSSPDSPDIAKLENNKKLLESNKAVMSKYTEINNIMAGNYAPGTKQFKEQVEKLKVLLPQLETAIADSALPDDIKAKYSKSTNILKETLNAASNSGFLALRTENGKQNALGNIARDYEVFLFDLDRKRETKDIAGFVIAESNDSSDYGVGRDRVNKAAAQIEALKLEDIKDLNPTQLKTKIDKIIKDNKINELGGDPKLKEALKTILEQTFNAKVSTLKAGDLGKEAAVLTKKAEKLLEAEDPEVKTGTSRENIDGAKGKLKTAEGLIESGQESLNEAKDVEARANIPSKIKTATSTTIDKGQKNLDETKAEIRKVTVETESADEKLLEIEKTRVMVLDKNTNNFKGPLGFINDAGDKISIEIEAEVGVSLGVFGAKVEGKVGMLVTKEDNGLIALEMEVAAGVKGTAKFGVGKAKVEAEAGVEGAYKHKLIFQNVEDLNQYLCEQLYGTPGLSGIEKNTRTVTPRVEDELLGNGVVGVKAEIKFGKIEMEAGADFKAGGSKTWHDKGSASMTFWSAGVHVKAGAGDLGFGLEANYKSSTVKHAYHETDNGDFKNLSGSVSMTFTDNELKQVKTGNISQELNYKVLGMVLKLGLPEKATEKIFDELLKTADHQKISAKTSISFAINFEAQWRDQGDGKGDALQYLRFGSSLIREASIEGDIGIVEASLKAKFEMKDMADYSISDTKYLEAAFITGFERKNTDSGAMVEYNKRKAIYLDVPSPQKEERTKQLDQLELNWTKKVEEEEKAKEEGGGHHKVEGGE